MKGLASAFVAYGAKAELPNLQPPLFEFCSVYYVYCLKQKDGNLYFGYTSDLRRRLKAHKANQGDLVYYEAYKSPEDAIDREHQLKKYKSAWGQLKKRINRSRI